MEEVDVLVVGAGPTGLMMAAELCRYGLRSKIIDELPFPSTQSKALVLQARTLEIFHTLGIADQFLGEGLKLKAFNPFSQGKQLAHIPLSLIPSSYPMILSIEQSKTEKILTSHLARSGICVERGKQLLDLECKEEFVYASIFDLPSQKPQTLRAYWVVGCDGCHSIVRKAVGLKFKGSTFPQTFSLADVLLDWDHPHDEMSVFFEQRGPLVAIPLPEPHRYRLLFMIERCQHVSSEEVSRLPLPTLEEVNEALANHTHQTALAKDPLWMAHFRIHTRMTNRYAKGRLFLAGDASHIHSPVGGQGMNTGLQDAFNLAWKIAYVHKKKRSPALLLTYSLERMTVGKSLLHATEKFSKLAFNNSPLWLRIRGHLMKLFLSRKKVQKFMTKMLSQTAIRYPKSSLTWQSLFSFDKPKAGKRGPDAPLIVNQTFLTLQDLWQHTKEFQILLFTGPHASEEESKKLFLFATRLRASLKGEENIILITSYKDLKITESAFFTVAVDPQGKAHEIYGCKKKGVCILRPDLYIGYRSSTLHEKKLLRYLEQS